jgi:DNA ligase-1
MLKIDEPKKEEKVPEERILRKHVYPQMYALDSNEKIKQWQVIAEEQPDGTADIIRLSGQLDGKVKVNKKKVKKGKNIGKANETDPFQQANNQAASEFSLKQHKNYEEFEINKDDYVPRVVLPQLAKGPKKGKIRFPCDMQPKLNGICCLARSFNSAPCFKKFSTPYINWATEKGLLKKTDPKDDIRGIAYHSRGGHLFNTLEHMTLYLDFALPTDGMVHGELYVHGWSLQKIGSYTKDLKSDSDKLEYWIYDLPQPKLKWIERWKILQTIIKPDYIPTIRLVPTVTVHSYAEAKRWHDKWVEGGFEGGMLRNHNGYYMFQYNSNDLEKVKEFMDDEFEIIGGKEGTGNDEGCVIFRCVTKENLEFDVRPRGTVEYRQMLFTNLSKFIGKSLTVRFAEYSEDKKPQQPVGIPEGVAFRDYE